MNYANFESGLAWGAPTRDFAPILKADLFLDADRIHKEAMPVPPPARSRLSGGGGSGMLGGRMGKAPPIILPKPDDRKRTLSQLTQSGSVPMMSLEATAGGPSRDLSKSAAALGPRSGILVGGSFQPQYTGCRYDIAKPPYSYASLIAQALLAAPLKRLTLNQIYAWIMEKYPYYRSENSGWQNSIRHNLSLNSCFVRLAKSEGEAGKGCYWTVNEEELAAFKDGAFKRRKLGGAGRANRRRRRRASTPPPPDAAGGSISVEPIAPSICDPPTTNHPASDGADSQGDSLCFDYEALQYTLQTMRVNDGSVNGSTLRASDMFRVLAPGGGRGRSPEPTVVNATTELAVEERAWTFSTWELQKSASDVRTDYTDPLEMLNRL